MRKVYLDHSAAMPLLPAVREAMLPFLGDSFGNPLSLHDWGDPVREVMDTARERVAALVGADSPEEIIFTSSGTESNNFAVKGLAAALQNKGRHIVINVICVLGQVHESDYIPVASFLKPACFVCNPNL